MNDFPKPERTSAGYLYTFLIPASVENGVFQLLSILFGPIILTIVVLIFSQFTVGVSTTGENLFGIGFLLVIGLSFVVGIVDSLVSAQTYTGKITDKQIVSHRSYHRSRTWMLPKYYSTYNIKIDYLNKFQVPIDAFAALAIGDTVSIAHTPILKIVRRVSVEKPSELNYELWLDVDRVRIQQEQKMRGFDFKLQLSILLVIVFLLLAAQAYLRLVIMPRYATPKPVITGPQDQPIRQ